MSRVRISQVGLAASAVAAALTVAGCGGSNGAEPTPTPTSTSASASPAPTSSSSAAPTSVAAAPPASSAGDGLCKSTDLSLSVGHGDAGAGTVYRPLIFTNVSDHPCTIQGFPGVSYVAGADGHQVGQPAVRVGDKGAAIKLNKGETASAAIGFVNVQNYDPTVCQPQQVRGLRVYPPQETASMYLDQPGTGCANSNIPGDQLTVKTLVKGDNAQ